MTCVFGSAAGIKMQLRVHQRCCLYEAGSIPADCDCDCFSTLRN